MSKRLRDQNVLELLEVSQVQMSEWSIVQSSSVQGPSNQEPYKSTLLLLEHKLQKPCSFGEVLVKNRDDCGYTNWAKFECRLLVRPSNPECN